MEALSRSQARKSHAWLVTTLGGAAVALGIAAYWRCYPGMSPFWAPLAETLRLFSGGLDQPFGRDLAGSCPARPPTALQLARVLGWLAVSAGVVGLVRSVFPRYADRVRARMAGRITLVTGVSGSLTGMDAFGVLTDIATEAPEGSLVVLIDSGIDEALAFRCRKAGIVVVDGDPADPQERSAAFGRKRRIIDAVYFLSDDAGRNIAQYRSVRKGLAYDAEAAVRVPVRAYVRIDDLWRGDAFRREQLHAAQPWMADAISVPGAMAQSMADSILDAGCSTVWVFGSNRLVQALLSEFAVRDREAAIFTERPGDTIPCLRVWDPQARDVIEDFELFQARFGRWTFRHPVEPVAGQPDLQRLARKLAAEPNACVVVADPAELPVSDLPQRLAAKCPHHLIFRASESEPGNPAEPLFGRLFAVGPTLGLDVGVGSGLWGRMARLKHEAYRLQHATAGAELTESRKPFDELSAFYQANNVRPILTLMRAMAPLGIDWSPADLAPGNGSRPACLSQDEIQRLARLEHESWMEYLLAHGWTRGGRSDRPKRHPNLVPWEQLDGPDREKDVSSVFDTLELLALLGFRPYRLKHVAQDEGGWARYLRVGEVTATPLTEPREWSTENGDQLRGDAGDWWVESADRHQWTVKAEQFTRTYQHVEADRWQRVGSIFAHVSNDSEAIMTLEGLAVARSGDYIARANTGESWVIPSQSFRQRYVPDG
ncbi:RyR domain-containing protein [Arthrobacter ginkgonis]|uniref:RyR domain-containing protein n=1 Tax=Arthrobacter ginkgonis TaxID=1630594 RepID=UPI0031E83875